MNLEEKYYKLREVTINNSYINLGRVLDLYRESRTKTGQPIIEFKEIFKYTNQSAGDITKIINPYLLDNLFCNCEYAGLPIIQDEKNGSDCLFPEEPHEIKITSSKLKNSLCITSSWTGNKFLKVPKHILMSYYLDFDTNRISHMFLGIIDLSKCKSSWKNGSDTANFSNLKISIEDADNMQIIVGGRIDKVKNTTFILEKLKIN